MVKRFLTARAGTGGRANRYAPETQAAPTQFNLLSRKAIQPDPEELQDNVRARSARLRVAERTDAPAGEIEAKALSMPLVEGIF